MKNFMQSGPKAPAVKAKITSAAESPRTRLMTGQGVKVASVSKPDKAGDTVNAGMVMPTEHPASTTTRTVKGTQGFVE